jgi:hypothetical protein
MFGSVTSPERQRVNTLRLIHSLARRACILNASSEHGAVQLGSGEEVRDQLGERPGVNRPVERHTGRLTPTARHELAGRLFVRWCLSPLLHFAVSNLQ